VTAGDSRFRAAAWTYFVYGVIYWVVALYLQLTVLSVRQGLLVWFAVGALIAIGVPWLLVRRRPGFERWVLSRRDFARIITVLVAVRAVTIAWLAWQGPEALRMPRFGGGIPSSQMGAWLMALVAAATAVVVGRAAWASERSP
jgi:hypothetical protein